MLSAMAWLILSPDASILKVMASACAWYLAEEVAKDIASCADNP
jgi:hypothetical protein